MGRVTKAWLQSHLNLIDSATSTSGVVVLFGGENIKHK